ncbi:MAG: sensor histidine kinase, partial [Chloroflexaceae bacterium]|nr:sensor histidine kinase [Chloroflexaceae bacterium]
MLITPHQFVSPAYLAFQPGLPWWGTAFLVVGGALLSVTVLAMNRPYVATAELAAALLLLLLAAGFWRVNGWTGVVVYGSLGLGLMLAALQLDDYRLRSRPDLLALMVGLSSAINGLIILLAPGQFTGFFYDAMRWHLPLNGAAFLLSGLALLAAHLLPRMPQLLFWLCHLLAAGALGFWFFTNPLPLRLLTGYGYYGGVGLAMALLPWLGPKLVRTDPAALRVRLALLLAACAALPLILTLTLITNQQEQLAARQTMTTYQFDAQELAGNISRVVQMHRAALATLAVDSNLAVLPASEQQARLAAFQQRYPSFSTVLLLRPDQPLVVSNAATAPPDIPATVVEQLRTTGGPQLLPSANDTAPPVVLLGAPLRSPSGQLSGTLIGLMDEASLPTELSVARTSADMVIYLTTADGALLAQPESRPATSRAAAPPLQALAASDAPAGTLRYTSATGEWLSGFARLPDLNWNVVVERPVNAALATVWAGRELAFLALLGMMGVAVLAGLLLARQLAHPLDQLAKAADRLAEGNTAEPLPQSRISEVAHLSAIFGTMRDRLVARTAERDTLYEAERAARETAEAAVQMRETFLSVASHELKTPLTSLLGNTELLQRRASREQLLNERNLRSVNVIHEQAQRLSRLIEALLDISRLQKGQLT